MKLRTRKFLAGLLSLGMLLQVASPLSALAADGGAPTETYSETVDADYLDVQADTPQDTEQDDSVIDYGITVTLDGATAYKVTSETFEDVLQNQKLVYTPNDKADPSKGGTLSCTSSLGRHAVKIEVSSNAGLVDVKLSNDADAAVCNDLTVIGAQNVTVTGSASGKLVNGGVNVSCSGDLFMKNSGTGDVMGIPNYSDYTTYYKDLVVEKAQNVTIHSVGRVGTGSSDSSYAVNARAVIDCSGDVEITSDNGRAVYDPVQIKKADNVTIKAKGRAIWDQRGNSDWEMTIKCIGDIEITSEEETVLYAGNLTIAGAKNVLLSGSNDSGAVIGGNVDITCSGTVTLENKASGKAVSGELKYNPTHTNKYEIKTGTTAASAKVVYPGESSTAYTGAFNDSYINIALAGNNDNTPDDTGTVDSGSDVGGAVAAVMVGGAAVLGGYEITTRVILHNILPEGASIPANRGQLAWLIWGTKGAPLPENQPVFTDVSDPEMAMAAQWCVEQGIMDTKTEDTFNPEGWTPKFKVIETWNKAFPQK